MSTARGQMMSAQGKYKQNFDERLRLPRETVKAKAYVFVRRDYVTSGEADQKLMRKANGPFRVKVVDENTCTVEYDTGECEKISLDRVVLAPTPGREGQSRLTTEEEDESSTVIPEEETSKDENEAPRATEIEPTTAPPQQKEGEETARRDDDTSGASESNDVPPSSGTAAQPTPSAQVAPEGRSDSSTAREDLRSTRVSRIKALADAPTLRRDGGVTGEAGSATKQAEPSSAQSPQLTPSRPTPRGTRSSLVRSRAVIADPAQTDKDVTTVTTRTVAPKASGEAAQRSRRAERQARVDAPTPWWSGGATNVAKVASSEREPDSVTPTQPRPGGLTQRGVSSSLPESRLAPADPARGREDVATATTTAAMPTKSGQAAPQSRRTGRLASKPSHSSTAREGQRPTTTRRVAAQADAPTPWWSEGATQVATVAARGVAQEPITAQREETSHEARPQSGVDSTQGRRPSITSDPHRRDEYKIDNATEPDEVIGAQPNLDSTRVVETPSPRDPEGRTSGHVQTSNDDRSTGETVPPNTQASRPRLRSDVTTIESSAAARERTSMSTDWW